MSHTASRSRRVRIYLLTAGLAWGLLSALAGNEACNRAIRGITGSMIAGLDAVDPFFVVGKFVEGFTGVPDKPREKQRNFSTTIGITPPFGPSPPKPFGLLPETDRLPGFIAWTEPIQVPEMMPPPGRSPNSLGLFESVWRGMTRAFHAVRERGWPAAIPAILSVCLGLMFFGIPGGGDGQKLWFFHLAMLFLFIIVVLGLAAGISWILQLVLTLILRVFGASLTLVAALSAPILAIDAVWGWLEKAKKVREVVALSAKTDDLPPTSASNPPAGPGTRTS